MNTPTPKQKALLEYLEIRVPSSKSEASQIIEKALTDEHYAARLSTWNLEKLVLHPKLYESEAAERKRSRAESLWQASNDSLGEGFPLCRITKVQAVQSVAYLDRHFSGWDGKLWSEFGVEVDALYEWFAPAVAATNPDAVKKGFSDSLSFPSQSPGVQGREFDKRRRAKSSWFFRLAVPIAVIGVIGLVSKQRRRAAPPPAPLAAPSTPAPIPTFATMQDAQKEAVRRYPDLGIAGTQLHSEFLAIVETYKANTPRVFENKAWPLILAIEASERVGKLPHVRTQNP